jgi:hypothetical protein
MWSLTTAAVATPALAQDGQGVGMWLFDVTTQDGDAIVEPGETATISLFLDMDPSVGEQLPDGSFLYAFAAVNLDVLGGANAANGQVLGWEGNDALTQLAGDTGTTDGVSIFGVELGQIGLGISDFSDPIHLLSFEWEPMKAGAYGVEYEPTVDALGGPGFIVWTWDGQNNNALDTEFWAIEPGTVQFQVVPAPALPSVAGLALLTCARRRRRNSR